MNEKLKILQRAKTIDKEEKKQKEKGKQLLVLLSQYLVRFGGNNNYYM